MTAPNDHPQRSTATGQYAHHPEVAARIVRAAWTAHRSLEDWRARRLEIRPAYPRRASVWWAEANRRWPNGPDLTYRIGDGPWATVAWCTALSVVLHPSRDKAERALELMLEGGCGHVCWGDHELVNLAEPEEIDPDVEYQRGPQRADHLSACYGCREWSPKASSAAMARASARRRRAVARTRS